MKRSVLIGTRNPAKAQRLRHAMSGLPVRIREPEAGQEPANYEEDGSSHLAIACGKAAAWSRTTGDIVVASDGGVEIPLLGASWRSITTRRATGREATDEERAERLMGLLKDHPPEERQAWWIEALAVAYEGLVVAAWEARGLQGELTDAYLPAPAKYRGFWVYGMWYFPQFAKHYWELSEEELRQAREPWYEVQPWLRGLVERLVSG
jgi:inosine/xanthosine triphosphate pyrophosphatase family protein